jgi:hypothetical protein
LKYLNSSDFDFKSICKGFVNYRDKKKLIFSRGKTIYEWKENQSYEKIISLHRNFLDLILCNSQLYQRFSRSHVQHVIPVNGDHLLIFLSGRIYYIDSLNKTIINSCKLRGSQPLQIAKFDNTIYYGEYIRSQEHPPIHLLRANPPYTEWEEVKKFNNIRHIHGVFRDPYNDTIWITTGDDDHECWIMNLSKDDYSIKFKIGGSQLFRAVTLLFTDEYIYYGTDSQSEKNYICRFKRGSCKVKKMTRVGGPVFYGTKVSQNLYFSTASEPGKYNRNDTSEIWGSTDEDSWNLICELKKDFWHHTLFRFGLVFFPFGQGDDQNLWFSSIATNFDNQILKKSIIDL